MPLSSTSTATRRRFFHVAAVKTTLLSALLLANSPLSAAADGRDADRRAKCSGCSRQASVRLLGPGASGPLALVPFDPEGTSVVDDEIASVRYFPEYEETGWDRLEISVAGDSPVSESVKARAVGFAEGFVQADRIYQYWTNYRHNEFKTVDRQPTAELLEWLGRQERFVRDNIRSHACPERGPEDAGAGEDEYWRRMGLVMDQFDGLCEGVWSAALPGRNISYWELYVLQSVGDLYDLTVLYPQRGGIGGLEAEEPSQREYRPGHGSVGPGGYGAGELLECSAIIKLDGAILTEPLEVERRRLNAKGGWRGETGRGFWAGHTTWRPFYAMLRTWKIYDLPWSRSGRISVSSSPGFVGYSKDDWYTTERFVVMETTNGLYNKSLYDAIVPECALMWQRVQVANLGAASGEEWVSMFASHNSGTYNNQWMVLDVEALQGERKEGVLWVLEQLPGTVEAADVSEVLLSQGYWPSFNVPYFPRIYNMSGYPADQDIHRTTPRAKLFAREQSKVKDLEGFMRMMRLNKYQADPLSEGDPTNTIAARYDLEPTSVSPVHNWTCRAHGAVDAKVVGAASFAAGAVYAINGPTDEDQPAFSWSNFCHAWAVSQQGVDEMTIGVPSTSHELAKHSPHFCNVLHDGLVDKFDFSWQYMIASSPMNI